MAYANSGGRWWEFYLVRYLMPSVAGIIFVIWLSKFVPYNVSQALYIPDNISDLNIYTLLLLFLYGNLFCYIASYPILVFHATRVIENRNPAEKFRFLYVLVFVVVVLAGALYFLEETLKQCMPGLILGLFLMLFCAWQLYRIFKCISKSTGEETTLSYWFIEKLSIKRAGGETKSSEEGIDREKLMVNKSRIKKTKRIIRRGSGWEEELVDSYRHMREHGNSAFIFLLEFVLASLIHFVFFVSDGDPFKQVVYAGLLIAVWTVPAMFVHMLGQVLESEFVNS